MKLQLFLLLFLTLSFGISQNRHEAIVVDSDGKEPVEFVGVYNSSDHTITNADGRFSFSSSLDSITFYRIGYEKFTATFTQLKDTVFLKKSLFELDEVVVTNAKTIYQKIKDSVASNYLLKPHTETFFIRALLRRNDTIVRLQDMQGKVKRKTSIYAGDLKLDKKDYEIELKHMRQLGISKGKDDIYFQFPSFFTIYSEFVRLNAMGPEFEVIEKPFEGSNDIKVEFNSNNPENQGKGYGHYIINGTDNAILSFNATSVYLRPAQKDNKTRYSWAPKNEVSMFFRKDQVSEKYYMNFAKRNTIVELIGENQSRLSTYEMEIVLYTTQSLGNDPVKSNINEQKDVFKLKHTYDPFYWQAQNQLLLTEEMENFIKKIGEENKEFKVRGNMN